MRIILNAGSLDGQSLIEMNNLAVGYFPTGAASVGVYPQPSAVPTNDADRSDRQPNNAAPVKQGQQ